MIKMHALIKKLGFSNRIAALIMLLAGAIIFLNAVDYLWKDKNIIGILIAAYLIIVGLLKFVAPEK